MVVKEVQGFPEPSYSIQAGWSTLTPCQGENKTVNLAEGLEPLSGDTGTFAAQLVGIPVSAGDQATSIIVGWFDDGP